MENADVLLGNPGLELMLVTFTHILLAGPSLTSIPEGIGMWEM